MFLVSFFLMAFSKRTGKFRKCGGGMSPFFRQHERAIRGRMLRILTDLIQRGFGSRLPKQSSITGYEIAFCKGWPPSGRLLLKIGATFFVWTLFCERAPPSVFGKRGGGKALLTQKQSKNKKVQPEFSIAGESMSGRNFTLDSKYFQNFSIVLFSSRILVYIFLSY